MYTSVNFSNDKLLQEEIMRLSVEDDGWIKDLEINDIVNSPMNGILLKTELEITLDYALWYPELVNANTITIVLSTIVEKLLSKQVDGHFKPDPTCIIKVPATDSDKTANFKDQNFTEDFIRVLQELLIVYNNPNFKTVDITNLLIKKGEISKRKPTYPSQASLRFLKHRMNVFQKLNEGL